MPGQPHASQYTPWRLVYNSMACAHQLPSFLTFLPIFASAKSVSLTSTLRCIFICFSIMCIIYTTISLFMHRYILGNISLSDYSILSTITELLTLYLNIQKIYLDVTRSLYKSPNNLHYTSARVHSDDTYTKTTTIVYCRGMS